MFWLHNFQFTNHCLEHISMFWFYIFQFAVHCLEHISKRNHYFKCIEKYLSQFWFNKFQFTGLCSNPISKYSCRWNVYVFVHNFWFTIHCLEHISKRNYYFKCIEKYLSKFWFNKFTFHCLNPISKAK